ncbi:unnamed protein product [Brassica oleracea]
MGNSHMEILKNKKKIFILNNHHKNQISCSKLGIPHTVIIHFFPELEFSVDDNCVGDGRDGVGLGFPETHRFVVKFCHSDGMTGS